jgi:hypothetical protein
LHWIEQIVVKKIKKAFKLPEPKFKLPKRTEIFLIVLAFVSLFFLDVSENKVLDKGLDYKTTWFGDIQTKAISNFYVGIFVYFVSLLLILALAIFSRSTHWGYDLFFGGIGLFGLFFMGMGWIADFHQVGVPFFGTMLQAISTYHLGISSQIIALLWFGVTE